MKNMKMLCFLLLVGLFMVHATAAPSSVDQEKLNKLELSEVFDVSIKIKRGMITWDNLDINTTYTIGYNPQKPNQVISTKILNLRNHMGTHVDAPGHADEKVLAAGGSVDSIDLTTLNGPALVVQVPEGSNITAEVMKSLNIPRGVKRVLFRTDNSDKNILGKTLFTPDYTGFTQDGAKWLAENTDIKLVGCDYLSVAAYDQLFLTHKELLAPESKIVPLETLDLRKISPGWYMMNCLPLNIEGIDGSPTRCILSNIIA